MENNINKQKAPWSRKKKISLIPIIFSGILAAGSVAGAGLGIWQVARNYEESSEFSNSVKGRVKIDPFGNFKGSDLEKTYDKAKSLTQEAAEKLSRWLKDKGQANYDVAFECYENEDSSKTHEFDCYLTANFLVNKVKIKKHISSDDDADKKIDNDPYLSFFSRSGFNSNEKTLVYRWYLDNGEEEPPQPRYTIIPFRELFQITQSDKVKAITDDDAKYGVLLPNSSDLTAFVKDLAQAKIDSQKESDSEQTNGEKETIPAYRLPRLYVVNNLQGLINEANYHIANQWVSKEDDPTYYDEIYADTTYAKFATTFRENSWDNQTIIQEDPERYKLDDVAIDNETKEKLPDANIFNYVDNITAGKIECDFIKNYIEDIVTCDNMETYFPQKINDDYKNNINYDSLKTSEDITSITIQNFWLPKNSENDAKEYIKQQKTYGFNTVTFANPDLSKISTYGIDGAKAVLSAYQDGESGCFKKIYVAPSFEQTIFGSNHVVGILSLGFLIFLVALLIILAVLYRTTGVFSWICLMFALSMTLLISTIGSAVISLSLILGLFSLSLVGGLVSLLICERMKRRLKSNEDTHLIVKKTFISSLLPVCDLSFITLLFGVCITYIAPIALNPMGVSLIVGAFAIFICLYLLNGGLHLLLFNNALTFNKYQFFGENSNIANESLYSENNKEIPQGMDPAKLNLAYYNKFQNKKIDVTGKKAMIAMAIVAAILLVGIIVFSVFGLAKSSLYQDSYCLAINTDKDITVFDWFKNIQYTSIKHELVNVDGQITSWWYIFSNDKSILSIVLPSGSVDQYFVQTLIGFTSHDILGRTLLAVITATSCCSIYGIIRFNWLSFVPMFVGSFVSSLFLLGLISIFQITLDSSTIIVFAMTALINTAISGFVISSINDAWRRNDPYNANEFKFIVNLIFKDNIVLLAVFAMIYGAFLIAFGLTAPINMLSSILIILISIVVSVLVVPFAVSYLTYIFMLVRNKALSKKIARLQTKVVKNYDDIDEQGIEGINKFTKVIPVAKPTEVKKEND